ncbi:hypothetical protein [Burkholderia gladioli]|uniref:hypothetical protein n=1 Tax=Burkholderia gladioli TaxID=28095 RepID=UPI001640AAE6|nr:hypothetical protein [Burkholderia gladioli]
MRQALARPKQSHSPFVFSKALHIAAAQPAPVADRTSNHDRALRRAFDCEYPPSVRASDLLHIDFNVHEVRSAGLYFVETLDEDMLDVEWHGVRHFDVTSTGLLMDQGGNREWIPANLKKWRMRIAGRVMYIYRSTEHGIAVLPGCRSATMPSETTRAQLAVSAALAAAHANPAVTSAMDLLSQQVAGTGGVVLGLLRELSVYDLSFVLARTIPAGAAHHDCIRRTDAREHALAYIEQVGAADALHGLDLGRALTRRLTCRYFGGKESIASIVDIFGMSESKVRRRARAVADVLEPIEREVWARLVPLLRDVGALDPAWQSSHRWNLERRGSHDGA